MISSRTTEMNSIRADHCVSLCARAVGKCQRNLSRALFQPSQFFVEMDDLLGNHCGESIM